MKTHLRDVFISALFVWGCAISVCLAQDAKPNSSAPIFKVGDMWKFQYQDVANRRPPTWFSQTVTALDEKEVVLGGEASGGAKSWLIYDLLTQKYQSRFAYDGAAPDKRGRKTSDLSGNDGEVQFPLEVGRKWPIKERFVTARYEPLENDLKAEVASYEKVKTQAGEFDSYRTVIDGTWKNVNSGNTGGLQANCVVRTGSKARGQNRRHDICSRVAI